MKSYTLAAAIIGLCSQTLAFPAMMTDPNSPLVKRAQEAGLLNGDPMELLKKRQDQGAGAAALAPIFDAKSQYVSNTGAHSFVAPGPLDARGPCPGLNAMANHGYIPHNGVATIDQFITGTFDVFGMGTDLATFLAVYGAVVDGTLTGWSIGGAAHTGIGGSHGNYETDNGPVYGDLNQFGSNEKVIISQFNDLFELQPNPATANYNLEVLREHRASRFQESIAKNPYFTYNAFGGIAVSQAAFTFVYRFMANHSAEHPEGILNQDVLKSFFSVTGNTPNNFKWTKGYEKIPNNWYRRNAADAYTIPYFQLDILYFAETVPQILEVGCNQGKVNTYNTISAETISGGAYTAASVAANPLCFAAQSLAAGGASLLGLPTSVTGQLTSAVQGVSAALGMTCPPITNLDLSQLKACPGFSLYGGPSAPVAPGSIQT